MPKKDKKKDGNIDKTLGDTSNATLCNISNDTLNDTSNIISNTASNIEIDISDISTSLSGLETVTNLSELIQKHKSICLNIDDASNKLLNIKKSLNVDQLDNSNNSNNSENIIDKEIYDKYHADILNSSSLNVDSMNLSDQIILHNNLSIKMRACEKYLKSKKMELVECDKQDN
jgi:maltodextrin utilization protein YvdJ